MTNIPPEKQCLVCKTAEWKYKCSTCLLKHCSLNCFKCHKNDCVKPQEDPQEQVVEIPIVPIDLGDDCCDYIPTRVLKRLRTSERLKELLSNRHLRDYLLSLDSSPRPSKAIEKAMREPLFVEFADECLSLVNPDDQSQQNSP